jgi:hypothetical protein
MKWKHIQNFLNPKGFSEHRHKREGYVQGVDNERKSRYSITPKGIKLLA